MKDWHFMQTRLAFTCLMFSLTTVPALAHDCGDIRLDQNNGSASKLEIHNQQDVGDCTSEVAAQMIDAYRFSHGDTQYNKHLSPMHLGLYATWADGLNVDYDPSQPTLSPNYMIGHHVEDAINKSHNNDICSFEEVVGAFHSDGSRFLVHLRPYLYEQSKFIYDKFPPGSGQFADETVSEKVMSEIEYLFQISFHMDAQTFEKIKPELTMAIHNSTPVGFLSRVLFPMECKTQGDLISIQNIPIARDLWLRDFQGKTTQDKLKSMSTQVSGLLCQRDAQPVGFTMCSDYLFSDKKSKMTQQSQLNWQHCEPHALIIIGQRYDRSGKKSFLVRNSWGKAWCPETFPASACEGGQFWLPEADFESSAIGITSLD